jgi:uncharacterized protein (TIGR02246 family)
MTDEQAIRNLLQTWMDASKRGDIPTVMNLMTDDVVFMVPGREPFGKAAFAASSEAMKGVKVEGTSEIVELEVLGDWAWARTRLRVAVTPPEGPSMVRSGYTMTLFRKEGGRWLLTRDANMLAPEKKG